MKFPVTVLLVSLATVVAAAESPPPSSADQAVGFAFKPLLDNYYPAASAALKEQGVAKLSVCYDERGRPETVKVVESSGYSRLDDAAVRYGRAVRIKPVEIDGKSQSGCVTLPVQFVPDSKAAPSEKESAPH